jgi:hypothetical protein
MSKEFRIERVEPEPSEPQRVWAAPHESDCKCIRCKLPPYANTSPRLGTFRGVPVAPDAVVTSETVTVRVGDEEWQLEVQTITEPARKIRVKRLP